MIESHDKPLKMSKFALNIILFSELNDFTDKQINQMFGWSLNGMTSYRHGRETREWDMLCAKTGLPRSIWQHTIIPRDRMPIFEPRLKRTESEDESMVAEPDANDGYKAPLISVNFSKLLLKIHELEQRIAELEKKNKEHITIDGAKK